MEAAADVDRIFLRLMGSKFRAKQKLRSDEIEYIETKGITEVLEHARQFIIERLADAQPANDGKQTPMHGHPAFVAQHATATCCRGCLMKWHGIAAGRELTEPEVDYIVDVIDRWLCLQGDVASTGLRVVTEEVTEPTNKSLVSGEPEASEAVVASLAESTEPEIAPEVHFEEAVIINIGSARPPEVEPDELEVVVGIASPEEELKIQTALAQKDDSAARIDSSESAKPKRKQSKKKDEPSDDGWVQGMLF